MNFTERQQQQMMYRLRCAAERDPDDEIANLCSQLAFELETPRRHTRLTEQDIQLIKYAVKKIKTLRKKSKNVSTAYE